MAGTEPFPLLSTSVGPLDTPADHGRFWNRHAAKLKPRQSITLPSTEYACPVGRRSGAAAAASAARRQSCTKPRHAASSRPRSSQSAAMVDSVLLRLLTRRTWALPLTVLLAVLATYAANPAESSIAHPFIFLSYPSPAAADGHRYYGKGTRDFAFVAFYTVFLSFTREFVMHEVLLPLARLCGVRSCGKQARFMEQTYTACYTAVSGPLGLYAMKRTPGLWYFRSRGMFEGFPHEELDGVFKFYYLFQAAFWAQQAIVMLLGQEKPRKDFKELISHHVVTIGLIYFSFRYHFTHIGIAIYITHDISDFFLAVSKSLNYLDHPAQSYSFALCIAVWIYLRHYLNIGILYAIATEDSDIGLFYLDAATGQYQCRYVQLGTFALLAALQGLNLFWLYCLFRSAYRFVVLGVAKDDRSEAEESEVEEDAVEEKGRLVVEKGGDEKVVVEGEKMDGSR
ncbi:sphingosine N-acyltransferase LAG1 [Staphylotrichum tortipilum]|uniref:Sphingosine N-acyltransferase LAG1 n=1 Tax=Staphylotrichum tortipilum TaxID=2831512 RepID=A0AAN6MH49_9PEZI|nr:sphingosine N-acyltransferase LAG1 [Staphylotrichum longicolle]